MRKLGLGLALALAVGGVGAQDGKGYVALGAGVSKYDISSCDSLPPGFSCDESGKAWNARAGYMFMPWLGVEASYLDFGEANTPGFLLNPPAGTVSIPVPSDKKAFGFALSLVGRVPLGPVNLNGRVGWGAITGKFVGNGAAQNTTTGAIQYFNAVTRDTTGRLVYGVGAGVEFAQAWTARIDWDRTKAEDGLNPEFDVEMYTLGVSYRF